MKVGDIVSAIVNANLLVNRKLPTSNCILNGYYSVTDYPAEVCAVTHIISWPPRPQTDCL